MSMGVLRAIFRGVPLYVVEKPGRPFPARVVTSPVFMSTALTA